MPYPKRLARKLKEIELQELIDKLQYAGKQLVRYGNALQDDDRESIEYTSGIEGEWLQAITQWAESSGKLPEEYMSQKCDSCKAWHREGTNHAL